MTTQILVGIAIPAMAAGLAWLALVADQKRPRRVRIRVEDRDPRRRR